MEEIRKKFPSLPSNYVTIQQLQERRLKEKEQKQKEKEEEEEHRRRLLEERRLKEKEEEEEGRRKLLEEQEMEREKEKEERKLRETQRARAIDAKASGRSNRRKPRNFSEKELSKGKESGSEMQKGGRGGGGGGGVAIGIAADRGISDEGQKPEEPKQKKKNRGKKKTMTQKTEAGSEAGIVEQSQAENGHEGNQIPVEPNEEEEEEKKKKMERKMKEEEAPTGKVEEKEPENGHEERITVYCDKQPARREQRIRGGIRRWGKVIADEKRARASGVKEESVNATVTVVEIAPELGDLAAADNHEQEEENHGVSMTFRAGSGRGRGSYWGGPKFGRGRFWGHGRNSRDGGGLMWVKKGDVSDGNGIQEAEAKAKAKAKAEAKALT